MTETDFTLPPELDAFASYLDAQLPNVRELFQYALAILMVEAGKARIVETHTTDDGREQLLIQTVAGDSFSIVKPLVEDALLEQMMEIARGVVAEDDVRRAASKQWIGGVWLAVVETGLLNSAGVAGRFHQLLRNSNSAAVATSTPRARRARTTARSMESSSM